MKIIILFLLILSLSSCLDEKSLGANPNTVNSVAGKKGDVTLAATDISGLGSAAVLNHGTSAGDLVRLNGSALIPSALIPPSGAVTLSGDVTGAASSNLLSNIAGKAITITNPTANDIIRYNGTTWVNVQQSFNQYAGELITFTGTTCPSGTVLADGSVYNRTTDVDLFNAVGCSHGCPTGTTFNVIDLRGRFARYVDQATGRDPDAGSRTAQQAGGATGDNVGSLQADMFASHTHIQDAHSHEYKSPDGNDSATGTQWFNGRGPSSGGSIQTGSTVATNQNTGGNETRPKNVNVLPCVRRYNR